MIRTTLKILVVCLVSAGAAALAQDPYREDPYATDIGLNSIDRTNQWFLAQIGLDAPLRESLARDLLRQKIIVAVIDTGIDYQHRDLSLQNIWSNPQESQNGKDDDGNGYVDDLLGWDFIDNDNDPWDYVGHGTHVAGVIAATSGNGEGIAGIDGRALVMPLRALNTIGRGLSTRIADAIYYAVDQGARVINLSMAIKDVSSHEQAAIRYANSKGVLVVVAAGNDADDAATYTPAGIADVITVASTGPNGERASFSNWGSAIDIAAPGTNILSLRAAHTDFMLQARPQDIRPLQYSAGPASELYRADGTSFSAPMVSAAAALIWSVNPQLSRVEVRRMILYSARDVQTPGFDEYTGHGVLNITAALAADPAFFLDARITGVSAIDVGGQTVVRVQGTADADQFADATLSLGQGEQPASWRPASAALTNAVRNGSLGDISVEALQGATKWTIRLTTRHGNGQQREARFLLELG